MRSTGALGMQRHADAGGACTRGMQIPSPPFPHNSYTVAQEFWRSGELRVCRLGGWRNSPSVSPSTSHLPLVLQPRTRLQEGCRANEGCDYGAKCTGRDAGRGGVGRSGQGAGHTQPLQGKGYRPDGGEGGPSGAPLLRVKSHTGPNDLGVVLEHLSLHLLHKFDGSTLDSALPLREIYAQLLLERQAQHLCVCEERAVAKRERRRGEERRGRWRGEGRVKLLGRVWEGTLTLQEMLAGSAALRR